MGNAGARYHTGSGKALPLMRTLLEAYRWITLAAFVVSGLILIVPMVTFFIPGYSVEVAPGMGYLGIALIAVTFAASGFNVIMIAIYDQLRAMTTEVEYARTELAYLREEMREHR